MRTGFTRFSNPLLCLALFIAIAPDPGPPLPTTPAQCVMDVGGAEPLPAPSGEAFNDLPGENLDSPLSTFEVDGQAIWVVPSVVPRGGKAFVFHSFYEGSVDQPQGRKLGSYFQSKLMTNSPAARTGTNGLKWITNTYQAQDGVLAFVHAEYTGKGNYFGMPCEIGAAKACGPGTSRIGLAWLDTSRPDFLENPHALYLGHIAGSMTPAAHFNVQGTPYVIHRDETGRAWFHIYFHDANARNWGHIAMARAPVDEVLAAARLGHTSTWTKRDGTRWTDALQGPSSPVLPDVPALAQSHPNIAAGRVIVHSDAARQAGTGRYFLSAYVPPAWFDKAGTPATIALYDSCDGLDWRLNRLVEGPQGLASGWTYLSLVDDDGSDNGGVGDRFHLYSGYEIRDDDRGLVRIPVRTKGCGCP